MSASLGLIQPVAGTVRIYVDGTLGTDGQQGSSWATAWKTLAYLVDRVSDILAQVPSSSRIVIYARGVFAAEDLRLAALLQGNAAIFIVHALADHTTEQSGTLTAVTAAAEKHGIVRLTLGGGIVLTAADVGRVLKLTDGANVGTSMIIRVDTVNNYCWTTKYTYPGWVVGGGVIPATIHAPSVSGISNCVVSQLGPRDFNSGKRRTPMALLGLNVSFLQADSGGIYWSGGVLGALTYAITVAYGARMHYANDSTLSADGLDILQEAGFIAGASGYYEGGFNVPNATYAGCSCSLGGYFNFRGYCNKRLASYDGYLSASVANIEGAEVDGQHLWFSRVMSRGQVLSYTHGGEIDLDYTTWQDLPAAGLPYGLVRMQGGRLHVSTANIEGNNTGTGSNLYGFYFDGPSEGRVQLPDAIKGEHGRLRIVNGRVTVTAAVSLAASEGGGPDILVDQDGVLLLQENFAKSATNPSSGGTAAAVIEVASGGHVSQTPGKTFTVATPAADWNTDYGAGGAIYLHEGAQARLGTLTGGAGGTTGTGANLRNRSQLEHGGVGLSGAAPIKLGWLAAGAWPVSGVGPYSDAAAVIPEGCWCVPGV